MKQFPYIYIYIYIYIYVCIYIYIYACYKTQVHTSRAARPLFDWILNGGAIVNPPYGNGFISLHRTLEFLENLFYPTINFCVVLYLTIYMPYILPRFIM